MSGKFEGIKYYINKELISAEGNEHYAVSLLSALSCHFREEGDLAIAMNVKTPSSYLDSLAFSKSERVRVAVAKNPTTKLETLKKAFG